MIAPLLLSVQAVAPPPVVVSEPDDIVVIANRLKAWRGGFKVRKGAVTCKTTASTGDAAVDAVGCQAITTCFSPIADQMTAISNEKADKAEKQRALNALLQTRVPCLADERRAGIARLVAARRGS